MRQRRSRSYLKMMFVAAVMVAIVVGRGGAPSARAQGILIPEERPDILQIPGPLPIKYQRVAVEIHGTLASTTIDQVFLNPHSVQMQGTYLFPIPERASISQFSMYMNGKKVEGEVLEREEAWAIYHRIVSRMKDPGLLDYVGKNLFRVRVFPIPVRGETRIELSYQETLPFEGGSARYVYPMNVERFCPKPLKEMTFSANITAPSPIRAVYSPSHELDVDLEGRQARCSFEESNVRPDRDVVLYITSSPDDVGMSLLTYKEKGEPGYFLLTLAPGRFQTGRARLGKDLIFVVDTSGSMKDKKIEQAREALSYCVNSLHAEDRFNIINFSTGVNPLFERVMDVNRNSLERAGKYIDGIRARGGTDINGALLEALQGKPTGGRPRLVVFVTDGQPTIGVTEIPTILENVARNNGNGEDSRIFVFGLGYDVNTHLLDRLAENNRGTVVYIKPDEDLDEFLGSFISRVSEPVLSDLDLELGSVRVSDSYPRRLPDLFQGGQVLWLGRYQGNGRTIVTLQGLTGEEERSFAFRADFPSQSHESEFIPRLWASRRIGHLLSEIRFHGEKAELKEEVIRLSRRHGIVTPYTSMLVLEDAIDHNLPAAQTESFRLMAPSAGQREGMAKSTGRDSVEALQSLGYLQGTEREEASSLETVTRVGTKTFYSHGGEWVDSEYKKDMRVTTVTLFSERYFELLRTKPKLGRFFALGEQVTVVFEGTAYKVVR